MRTTRVFVVVFAFSSFLSWRCDAQEPARAPTRPRITFAEVLRREDANRDQRVTKEEFKAADRLFERLDSDRDGVLTKQDFAGARQRRGNKIVPDDVTVLRDVVFGQGGGRDLTMHIVLPEERSETPLPAYVWIHGGGWQGGNKEGGIGKVVPLVREGFVGATIEYRLSGEATFPAQIEDCKCAIRFLRAHAKKYGIDVAFIAVGGSSAGGHLAALVGTSGGAADLEGTGGWPAQSSTVQAVVDLYGPTDFVQFVTTPGYEGHAKLDSPESRLIGGDVMKLPAKTKQLNPITYVDSQDPPFLILHGSDDRTVPSNQSKSLDKALETAGVKHRLKILDGAGHGGAQFARSEILDMQKQFLLQSLRTYQTKANP
jgi:acetyl esterase/lipase